jgi:hypothetical protein
VQPTESAPPVPDRAPPGPDSTRKWMFSDIITYDFATAGLGDIFMLDIPIARIGSLNSSISFGAGLGIIFSVQNSGNLVMPIPIAVTWRYGFGTTVEIDLRLGGAPYYYAQSSTKDRWGGKFLAGAFLRFPLSDTGGMALLIGGEIYAGDKVAALPEAGLTF